VMGESSGRNLGSGGNAISNDVFIGGSCGYYVSQGTTNATWIGSHTGRTGDFSNTVVLSAGSELVFDFNYLNNGVYPAFSFPAAFGAPVKILIYNLNDNPLTNWERVGLDWGSTTNVFRIRSEKGGTGTVRLIAIDGFSKAGAPAAGDLPASSYAVIDDTTNNQTWLVFNKAGTIRKVQLT